MKRAFYTVLSLTLLAGCTGFPTAEQNEGRRHAPVSNAQSQYSADGQDCNARASQRLSLYDKPGAYPLSDKERSDAYNALFAECMKGQNWQVAGNPPPPSANNLANLSPAAGGPATAPSPYPPGVIVIDTAHLNAGRQTGMYTTGSTSPGTTVILVPAQQAQAAPQPIVIPAAQAAPAPQQPTIISSAPQQPSQPVIIGSAAPRAQAQPVIINGTSPAPIAGQQPSASTLAAYAPAAGGNAPAPAPVYAAPAPQGDLEHIIGKTD